jgi:hypothetical protein
MTLHRTPLAAGIAALVVYTTAVIIGASLRPEYSHVAHAISELIIAGAPNKLLLDVLFGAYNILQLIFAMEILRFIRSAGAGGNHYRAGLCGAWSLIGVAVLGFATLFFPMDLREAATTPTGTIHLVLAGLSSLFSIATIFLLARWFGDHAEIGRLRTYSYAAGVIVLLTGAVAAASAATQSPYMGLAERVTIGTYIVWVGVVASILIARRRI